MDNVRFNISPCDDSEVSKFVGRIDRAVFVPRGEVRASMKSHYDRYTFLADGNRVALVYDTTAKILSVTGREDYAQMLLDSFGTNGKTVKKSIVPSQGTVPPNQPTRRAVNKRISGGNNVITSITENGSRAKLFVSPERIIRRPDIAPAPTLFVSSKGAIISTDEIYPPQTVRKKTEPPIRDGFEISGDEIYPPQVIKKRPLPSYGENRTSTAQYSQKPAMPRQDDSKVVFNAAARREVKPEPRTDSVKPVGIAISVGGRAPGVLPRKAVISFGTEDDSTASTKDFKINTRSASGDVKDQTQPEKRKRGRPPKAKLPQVEAQIPQYNIVQEPIMPIAQPEKRKRGRPPKASAAQDLVVTSGTDLPEYKNGYSVKNFPPEALDGAIRRLKSYGKTVTTDGTEFGGTPQEVKMFTVSDGAGQKVLLRYATKRMTLQLQGKRSDLFGEVMSQVSHDSDYSSALENYVVNPGVDSEKKVSDVQNKLKRRLPTAYTYLSEQSRIDFSYGIHDFSQTGLHLSDYSVLLVPAFRGLERFVFDLQAAEGIKVKMIGQAFDKDDSGKYILKTGYTQRIGSVIYAEVLVALYTEYFSQRNFFAHSDNTDSNMSRSIPERKTALAIFNHLLDVVEYNAIKLKEIGFKM